MKVKELIAHLQNCDPELIVVTHGYEGGKHEVANVEQIGLKLNVNTAWYYGEHEQTCSDEKPDAMAILID
jgi:hypothetical protein